MMNERQLHSEKTQSILCVIDFSEPSMRTMKWTAQMAMKLDVHLTIIHPYRLNQVKRKEDMVLTKRTIDTEAAQNFEAIASGLFKNKTLSYDFHAEVGFIQDRMQEYSRKNDLLFISIGKKLVDSSDHLWELLNQIEVPLVIV
jgi:hypothetical protein